MIHKLSNAGRRSPSAGAVLIIVLTVVAYLPTLHGGFVFDDEVYLTNNRLVKASDGLYRFWFTSEAQPYYPLTWSLWWLEWRLWDGRAAGYHAVNVLLHAVNAVLVWTILRRLKVPGAWVAGLVFAVHPVNVATVAWISEQKNTLSMFFYALAILLYLRFDEESGPPRTLNRGWVWYGLSLAAGLLAMLSKTAVVMLPVVLLGCVWWLRGRLRRKDWLCSVPYFVGSMALSLVTIMQHRRALEGAVIQTGGFAGRLAGAGWIPWFYLHKALIPTHLTVVYPKWEVDPTRWVSYVPGMILTFCLIVFWWKRDTWGRPLLFGLGYFVVMLFPVLGFFDQGFFKYSWVADHWQYYSIIGVIALVIAAGQKIGSRIGTRGMYVNVLMSAAMLIVLSVATWRRGCVYADSETLWRDNVAKSPNAWLAHNNLGVALEETGRFREAIGCYEQALWLKPDYAMAHNNLGIALAQVGELGDATRHFEEALRLKSDFAQAHYNLGVALGKAGLLKDAMAQYEQALRLQPDFAEAYYGLGAGLEQASRMQEAIGQYEQAVQIKPDFAEAQDKLAWLLATLGPTEGGDPVRAVSLAQRACAITDNRVAPFLETLTVAYAAIGRYNDAIAVAQRAIELARVDGQPELAREIEARLKLYRDGRAYYPSVDATRPHSP